MGAAIVKANTTIIEHEEQELSLRALEVLPEMLQVRAKLDKGWSLQYSKDYADGAAFPPIMVYRLPDERLVVADGFHRVDACFAIGKTTIRAQIREGTMHEALLAAIDANTAEFHRGRPFGEDDRRHAAELMFADHECQNWATNRIADRCGASNSAVTRWRNQYKLKSGQDIPQLLVTADGRERHAKILGKGERPRIYLDRRAGIFRARVGSKLVSLGKDIESANARLDEMLAAHQVSRRSLTQQSLISWLLRWDVLAKSCLIMCGSHGRVSAILTPTAILISCEDLNISEIARSIGILRLIRIQERRTDARLIVVCYPEDGNVATLDLGRQDGIEFLTPEELVESLKGEEAPPPVPAPA